MSVLSQGGVDSMNRVVDLLKVLSVLTVAAMFFSQPPSFGQKNTDSKVPGVKPVARPAGKTLPPAQVSPLAKTIWDGPKAEGAVAQSYAAAKAQPELMSKLFCYCGCDVSENMPSLLTCFQSNHSTDCNICQEEALLASRLHKKGLAIREIQVQVDRQYSSRYPFDTPSELLKRYEKARLY